MTKTFKVVFVVKYQLDGIDGNCLVAPGWYRKVRDFYLLKDSERKYYNSVISLTLSDQDRMLLVNIKFLVELLSYFTHNKQVTTISF